MAPRSDNQITVKMIAGVKKLTGFVINAASCSTCIFRDRTMCIRNPDISFEITDNNYCDRWKNRNEGSN